MRARGPLAAAAGGLLVLALLLADPAGAGVYCAPNCSGFRGEAGRGFAAAYGTVFAIASALAFTPAAWCLWRRRPDRRPAAANALAPLALDGWGYARWLAVAASLLVAAAAGWAARPRLLPA